MKALTLPPGVKPLMTLRLVIGLTFSSTFRNGKCVTSVRPYPRRYCVEARRRNERLREIYAEFSRLKMDPEEYAELARSGHVWERHFRPGNIVPYFEAQTELKETLREIDKFMDTRMQKQKRAIITSLMTEYAHQSTSLEQNPLHLGDAFVINEKREEQLFEPLHNMKDVDFEQVSQLESPSAEQLLPYYNSSQVAELRTYLLVSQWDAEKALANPGTVGLSIDDIKRLSATMLKDTASEKLHNNKRRSIRGCKEGML
jgi:hypothetical protein